MKRALITALILAVIFSALVMGCTSSNPYSGISKNAVWEIQNSDTYTGTLELYPDGNGCIEYASSDTRQNTKVCFRYEYVSGNRYNLIHDGITDTLEILNNGYVKTSLLNNVDFKRGIS